MTSLVSFADKLTVLIRPNGFVWRIHNKSNGKLKGVILFRCAKGFSSNFSTIIESKLNNEVRTEGMSSVYRERSVSTQGGGQARAWRGVASLQRILGRDFTALEKVKNEELLIFSVSEEENQFWHFGRYTR